jgi:hypothetical protein
MVLLISLHAQALSANFSNLSLDMDLVVLLLPSSEESVVVSIPRPLMLDLILPEKLENTSKKTHQRIQELLLTTLVTMSETSLVWAQTCLDLLLNQPVLHLLFLLHLHHSSRLLMPFTSLSW